MRIQGNQTLIGHIKVPGDKSISHRGIMLSALATGTSYVKDFLQAEDCLSTMSCFKQMGVPIDNQGNHVRIIGQGLRGLKEPKHELDTGNSGTTFRLLSGILSGQSFDVTLTGDESLQKRPMKRIIAPLTQMGAQIRGAINADSTYPPLKIMGSPLQGITYTSPVASAQVKSSILLAGLLAQGDTNVIEPHKSRDHTERMLTHMGHPLTIEGNTVMTAPAESLNPIELTVPGDISSAAFFLVAGSILPRADIVIENVGINPTRTGILDVLKEMGAHITIENERSSAGEPVADLVVRPTTLKAVTIEGEIIPRLIDELPILAVAACYAEGKTVIKDAAELKVKESNRIEAMVTELTKMGANVWETEDGMIIEGTGYLKGAQVDTYHDHRIAMSLAIAGLAAEGDTLINNSEIVKISYPSFEDNIKRLLA